MYLHSVIRRHRYMYGLLCYPPPQVSENQPPPGVQPYVLFYHHPQTKFWWTPQKNFAAFGGKELKNVHFLHIFDEKCPFCPKMAKTVVLGTFGTKKHAKGPIFSIFFFVTDKGSENFLTPNFKSSCYKVRIYSLPLYFHFISQMTPWAKLINIINFN